MRISTKGRYGLRAMVELGKKFGDGPVTMNFISDNQAISLKYLHALLASLRSAGLIRSVRGSKGGYTLAKSPKDISIKDILAALEGELIPVECVDSPHFCDKSGACAARTVWSGLSSTINNYLTSLSLQHLVQAELDNDNA